MKLSSHDIKAAVASYWRYTRQCRLVAFEWRGCPGGEMADVVAVDGWDHYILTEVKISLGDFRRDKFKWTHRRLRERIGLEDTVPEDTVLPFAAPPIHKISALEAFYFAVPKELANEIAALCDQLYPYAGVLSCAGVHDYQVEVHRKPKKFECSALKQEQVDDLIRAQTATLCRLATKVAEVTQHDKEIAAQLREYRKKEKLEKES